MEGDSYYKSKIIADEINKSDRHLCKQEPKSLQQNGRVAKATRPKLIITVLMDYLKKIKKEGEGIEKARRNHLG